MTDAPTARLTPEDVAEVRDEQPRWWSYGENTWGVCPHCGRERLMLCEDNEGYKRIVCEECSWEPAKNDYCNEILADDRD